jgi:hypothetical protein
MFVGGVYVSVSVLMRMCEADDDGGTKCQEARRVFVDQSNRY